MTTPDPFPTPPGWRRRRGRHGLVATAPGRPGPTPPRLEWRTGPPPPHDAVDVEDEDVVELHGHRVGYRRLGHRVRGVEVVSEEWCWRRGEECHVLTATVRREHYLEVCDLFEDVACAAVPLS